MPELDSPVLEAPVLDSTTPTLEPEPSAEPEGEEPPAPEEVTPKPGETALTPPDPKQLHQNVRAKIAEIRAKDPATADALKDAYYLKQDLNKMGFKNIGELKTFKDTYAQLGEPEQIQEKIGQLGYFTELDADFTAANPQVWDRIAEAGPEQFVKLFPSMTEKIETMAPEAFASWFSQRAIADLDQYGLRQDIAWLLRIVGDNAEAKGIGEKFKAYFDRLTGFASKPFAAPKAQPKTPAETQNAPNQERIELFRTHNQNAVNTEYTSELTKQLAGRQLSAAQKEGIAVLVGAALTRAESDADKKKIDRYYEAGDKQGYLNFKKSIRDRALPKAVESAIAATIGNRPGPKPGVKPVPSNGRPQPPAVATIKQVTQEPARNTVRWGRGGTTPDDVMKGIYTLNDGTKVQWRG